MSICIVYLLIEEKDGVARLEYTFKNDTLFKMLFVQHSNLLKHLVAGPTSKSLWLLDAVVNRISISHFSYKFTDHSFNFTSVASVP